MRHRRLVHSLTQRRFPMRAMEADCWRVETLCESHRTWRSVALKRAEPGFLFSDGSRPKGTAMNRGPTALAAALTLGGSFANAQSGAPSGAGSAIGDPRASSTNPSLSLTTGSSIRK